MVFYCAGLPGLDGLAGDVLFIFYHADKRNKAQQKATGGGDAKMFTCWFNTAFVGGPRLLLPKMHLDKATKDKKCKRFSRGFAVEFIFGPQATVAAGASARISEEYLPDYPTEYPPECPPEPPLEVAGAEGAS